MKSELTSGGLLTAVVALLAAAGCLAAINAAHYWADFSVPITFMGLPLIGLAGFALYQTLARHRAEVGLKNSESLRLKAEEEAHDKASRLATMSHEIRTPLNGVIGMLALINRSELTAEQSNYCTKAENSARTLLSMVDEILDTAKSEHQARGETLVELLPFVEGIAELLSPRAHAKDIDFSARVAGDLPKELMLNEQHLRQVLFNIAGNAIKFTERGGVAIDMDRDGTRLVIKLRDSGIGMSDDEAARVFDAYEQATGETQRRFGGTGLGLAITKKLVLGMGGEIVLNSKPGQGSTFIIHLPLRAQAEASQQPKPLFGRHYMLALPAGFVREQLGQTLADLGAEVSTLAEGESLANYLNKSDNRLQLICGTHDAQTLNAWARRKVKPGKAQAAVWVLLKPEERKHHAQFLQAPFAGYLLSPLRRSSLLTQLSARDSKALLEASRVMHKSKGEKAAASKAVVATARKLSVLLAEDNAVNALLTRTVLERLGHKVHVVADGGKALDELRGHVPFDLVILDIEMPQVSGHGVVEALRKRDNLAHRRHLPVLAMTANARPEDIKACRESGFDDHLPKPFDWLDLEEKVKALTAPKAAA